MEKVGVRVLKAQLSQYLNKVKAGEIVVVTEHGKEIAELSSISPERHIIQRLAKKQQLKWDGKKPSGCTGVAVKGKSIAETILEERR